MTFTPNIPASGQSLGETRQPIQDNFTALRNDLAVNHVDVNLANTGKHKFVEIPVGTLPAGAASEGTLYTKTSTGSQLFYTPDASANEYQMTRTIAASFARFGTNTGYATNHTGGWTFLPGGMLLQYGLRASPGSSGTITFPVAFTNNPYSISVSLYRNSDDHNVVVDTSGSPTTTGFKYLCDTSGNTGIYWWAIGV